MFKKTHALQVCTKIKWLGTVLMLMAVLFPGILQAQKTSFQPGKAKDFIHSKTENVQLLSNLALQRVQFLSEMEVHKRVHTVELPEHLYQEEILKIYVNPVSRELKFSQEAGAAEVQMVRSEVKALSDTEYAWKGNVHVRGVEEAIGSALFVQNRNGDIAGTIDVEGLFFRVLSLEGSEMHALIEFDEEEMERQSREAESKASPVHDGGHSSDSDRRENTPLYEEQAPPIAPAEENAPEFSQPIMPATESFLSGCDTDYIRALVLYTSGATNYGNMNTIIAEAIETTNEAWNNSQTYFAELALVHQQQFNFSETVDIEDDRDQLILDNTVNSLRNQYDADVVILLTEADAYYPYTGVAGTLHLENDKAYAIVDVSKTVAPRYTFPHELGHLQAAQHHPDDPVDPNPVYNYGYGHRISYSCGFLGGQTCRKATIMSYTTGPPPNYLSYSRIKYFSNPNKTYSGKALGIANQRENYRVLKNTSATVADFRNPNELKTDIFYQESSGSHSFTAQPCGGSGSYTYQWWATQDPSSYDYVESTNSVFTPTLTYGGWWIKLKVMDGIDSDSTFVSIWVEECDPQDPFCQQKRVSDPKEEVEQIPMNPMLLPAYPNPFNPTTEITFRLPETRSVSLKVYDMAGREVRTLATRRFEAGTHTLRFEAEGLSSGQYLLRLQAGDFIQTQTVTLIK